MVRYNHRIIIGSCFRGAEVCGALLLLYWILWRLPLAGEFMRRMGGIISSSHMFVFIIGNTIVVALLIITKSSLSSSDHTTTTTTSTEETIGLYKALLVGSANEDLVEKEEEEELETIVYQDKQVILSDHFNSNNPPQCENEQVVEIHESVRGDVDVDDEEHNISYGRRRRSISDFTDHKHIMKPIYPLDKYEEDKLSNEEFKKTVEAFIAKQLMFRRQESLSISTCN
ncbi:unnamed protein product [Cochlearia groenlandica]